MEPSKAQILRPHVSDSVGLERDSEVCFYNRAAQVILEWVEQELLTCWHIFNKSLGHGAGWKHFLISVV